MRPHVDAHLAGQLSGDIPDDWLRGQGFGTCEICQRVLSLRFNCRCPSCFRTLVSRPALASVPSRPLADGAPSVWDVFVSDKRVRSSVPKGARDAWSRCLISSLADIVAHRDVKAWTDFLTLPSLVLAAPSRGGRSRVLRHEGEVRRRCLDWLSGLRADLWAPAAVRKGQQRAPQDPVDVSDALPQSTINRVSTLIREGALRRACAALLQDPPVQPTDDVVASLRLLHPLPPDTDRADMSSLRRVAPQAAPVADSDQVRKALFSFPSNCGAGRSGLRPSHVRDALRPASSDLLLRLLSEVVSIMLRGEVPEVIRPYVCGASIMALRKPNGSLRPIAVGETVRRLASKIAVDFISEHARVILEPLQLGVKTPNGCEAIVHTARQWLHRHRSDANKVALSVDISNAFNSVHRSAVLRSVRVHFPSLAPWVDCCYRHDSVLFTGSSMAASQVISSARGVQQGDPLGPVLFALAIHPIVLEARAATEAMCPGGIDICSFYLDDGFCAGSAPAVRYFLSALVHGFRRIGLEVNLDKTEVIPACSSSQSFSPGDFQGCVWVGSSNFKLLGAPLGSSGWCEDLLGRRVGKARIPLGSYHQVPGRSGRFLFAPLLLRVVQGPLFLPYCSSGCTNEGSLRC